MRTGVFREDLLHRLRVGSGLHLVPLARREGAFEEVLPELLAERGHRAHPPITQSARDALKFHGWPGNLRELVGVLDECVALAQGDTVRLEHLPPHLQRGYLALPLHARALGFLLEEVDGQGLPEEHVSWRIEQINADLAKLPLPPQNEQLAMVGQFLSLIDDNSEDHHRAVAEVENLLELDQSARRASLTAKFWSGVAELTKAQLVVRLVQQEEHRANRDLARLKHEIDSTKKTNAISTDPWLRLLNDLRELPLLRGVSPGELGKAFISLFNVVKLVAPSVVDEVRADAKAGGLAKVRERLPRLLASRNDVDDAHEEGLPTQSPPDRVTAAEWNQIALFPTQRAAAAATGFDPKTIAKYLRKHNIPNPWKASRSSKPRKQPS